MDDTRASRTTSMWGDGPRLGGANEGIERDRQGGIMVGLRKLPFAIREVIAGGIAGGTAKTCVAPLERCKILYQTGRLHHAGIFPTLASIYRFEGIRGLFRGNGASVLRIIPYSSIHFGLYEQYRRSIVKTVYGSSDPHLPGVSPIVDLFAGSGAGATAVLITYPLDLVRTRLAFVTEAGELPTSREKGPGCKHRVSPGATSRQRNPKAQNDRRTEGTKNVNVRSYGTLARHPFHKSILHLKRRECEVRKIRQTRLIHLPPADPRHSIRGVLSSTLQNEGLRGLYHGIGPSLYGILPYAGLKFFVYQHLKQACLSSLISKQPYSSEGQKSPSSEMKRLPVPLMLLCGGIAGLIAQTATYPLDVVRRRMQVEGMLSPKPSGGTAASLSVGNNTFKLPSSTPAALVMIARRQGWQMLFNGLSINYMKVVPSTAIGFSLYDYFKHALDLPTHL